MIKIIVIFLCCLIQSNDYFAKHPTMEAQRSKINPIYLQRMFNDDRTLMKLTPNVVSTISLVDITQLIRETTTVSEITMDFTTIHGDNLRAITDAILENPSISCVSFDNNHFTLEDYQIVATMIERSITITSFNFKYAANGDDANLTSLTFSPLIRALFTNPHIQSIDFDNCIFTNDTVLNMATAMESNRTIRNINMNRCPFSRLFVQHFSRFIANNPALCELNLNECNINDTSMRSLCRAIEVNPSIRSMELFDNPIGDRSITSINSMIEHNHTIRTINLNRTDISREGGTTIASRVGLNVVFPFETDDEEDEEDGCADDE